VIHNENSKKHISMYIFVSHLSCSRIQYLHIIEIYSWLYDGSPLNIFNAYLCIFNEFNVKWVICIILIIMNTTVYHCNRECWIWIYVDCISLSRFYISCKPIASLLPIWRLHFEINVSYAVATNLRSACN